MKKLKLRINWNKKDETFEVHYPRSADGHWAYGTFLRNRTELILKTDPSQHLPVGAELKELEWKWHNPGPPFENRIYQEVSYDLVAQLIDRGFDHKTLKIEVSIDPQKLQSQFPHIYETLTIEEKTKLGID